jgi:MFS family permease
VFQWSLRPFDGRFRRYLLALELFTLGNSSDAFLLLHAQRLGMADWLLPLVWFVFHVAKSAGNLIAGRWVDRFGAWPTLLAGWLIYAVTYLLFSVASAAWQIWPIFLLYSLYYALAEPSEKTYVTLLLPIEHRGLAFGWLHLTTGLTALPASLAFGVLYTQFSPVIAFLCGTILAFVAALILPTLPGHENLPSGPSV